ncbi:hypothetical protein EIN_086740 [Entamoeba invadens IP1]|uniref:hypothetical protein n=1 Tax=Entamoeba invadens IP1 TaxID=370355 RepID=UPI0002C3F351|nr:hypothetical protein EIN_086740 [Entamoeba invadens IP1]ELP85392.1 hypothetical protein EIN_086740 [Entamoeba invadens IP1]|eukprot:XP_004184738.1 hypothetical protein EIN_086740 [Entamoeba invadens IP1]
MEQMAATTPEFYIERQTAAKTQVIGTKEIYVVVKLTNFHIIINSKTLSLETCEIFCELLYDTADMRPVPFVNASPIRFKVQHISQIQIAVECKLTVLSSQHEDSLFRVRIKLVQNKNVTATLLSGAIRSTSKIDSKKRTKFEELKKKEEKKPRSMSKNRSSEEKMEQRSVDVSMNETNILTLTLLSSNSLLLEQIQNNLRKDRQNLSFEQQILGLIRSILSIQAQFHTQCVADAFRYLSPTQITAMEEISTVFGKAYETSNPFAIMNQEPRYELQYRTLTAPTQEHPQNIM